MTQLVPIAERNLERIGQTRKNAKNAGLDMSFLFKKETSRKEKRNENERKHTASI
jgi:hypothetical protein